MPFTQEQFFQVFSDYHSRLGFTVFFFYFLTAITLLLLFKKHRIAVSFALMFLALLWVWMAVVYHGIFFSRINPAAPFFALLFIVEGALLILASMKGWFVFAEENKLYLFWSRALMVYALIIYPLLGFLFGHAYPAGPILGLPCPSTILTFAILIVLKGKRSHLLILHIIPVVWSVIGSFAALKLEVYADYFLLVSAFTAVYVLKRKG